jgi:hypothetical protein
MTEQEPETPAPLTPHLRELIAELDAWLPDQDEAQLVEHVLPFASEWILHDVEGLDVERLTDEAKTWVLANPLPDRVLLRFPGDASYWVGQRMLMDDEHRPDWERAGAALASAKALIAERAELLEAEGYGNVAAGFRRLLDETAGGEPPADPVWSALALRIVEPFLDDPANLEPEATTPSRPPSAHPGPSPE